MVSFRPLISQYSRPCTNPLVTVLGAPIAIDINVTFIFHSLFFLFSRNVQVFIFLFVVSRHSKVHYSADSLYYYYCFSLRIFHVSLSDIKYSQVSRTILSILTDLNSVIVWMVSTRPLISKSSIPFNNPLVIVPRAPTTIGISVTLLL